MSIPILPKSDTGSSGLRIVWMASLASMVLLCLALLYVFIERAVIGSLLPAYALILLLAQGPYGMILREIVRQEKKRGLVFGVGWGAAVFIASAWSFVASEELEESIFSAVIAMVQGVLVAYGGKAYLSTRRDPSDGRTLVAGLLRVTLYLIAIAIVAAAALPTMLHNPRGNEAAAMRSIKTINECAKAYSSRHPARGFPATLALMGPESEKCLEARLADGQKKYYRFTYSPGPANASGQISTYALRAQPVHFEQGVRNFHSDGSGVIRWTAERRDATLQDPTVFEPK